MTSTERPGDPEALAPSGGRAMRILNALLRIESLLEQLVELADGARAAPPPEPPPPARCGPRPASRPPSAPAARPRGANPLARRSVPPPQVSAGPGGTSGDWMAEVPEDWFDASVLEQPLGFGKFRNWMWQQVAQTEEHYLWYLVDAARSQSGIDDPTRWSGPNSVAAKTAAWILQWRLR